MVPEQTTMDQNTKKIYPISSLIWLDLLKTGLESFVRPVSHVMVDISNAEYLKKGRSSRVEILQIWNIEALMSNLATQTLVALQVVNKFYSIYFFISNVLGGGGAIIRESVSNN